MFKDKHRSNDEIISPFLLTSIVICEHDETIVFSFNLDPLYEFERVVFLVEDVVDHILFFCCYEEKLFLMLQIVDGWSQWFAACLL